MALATARQDLVAATAKLKESQAVKDRMQADFQRYQTLFDKKEVSRAEDDQHKATAAAQMQTIAANQAAVDGAEKTVDQRLGQLDQQRSNLKQTRNSAPLRVAIREADIKSQRANAEAAQAAYEKPISTHTIRFSLRLPASSQNGARSRRPSLLRPQPSMTVESDDLWVTANFKETELRMRPGQRVKSTWMRYARTFQRRLRVCRGSVAHDSVLPRKRDRKLRESHPANAGEDSLR